MTTTGPLGIQAVGLVTSVGVNAAASCAAVRARLSRFEEIPFHDEEGNPIIGAPASEAAGKYCGFARLQHMLIHALRECITSYQERTGQSQKVLVFLIAIDERKRLDYAEDLPRWLLTKIQEEFGALVSPASLVFPEGETGFFSALAHARMLLNTGQAEDCIVGAVDSLIDAPALQWLEERDRLKTEGNCDGVIPGEAAAAVWVTRIERDTKPLAKISGLGFGEELSFQQEGSPNVALGLAKALREALKDGGVPLERIDFRVGGMTGERSGFMEASTAVARIQRVHKDDFELWVPAEKLGDVGAALPAAMLVITVVGMLKKYAPGTRALLFVMPASSRRAACVVEAG